MIETIGIDVVVGYEDEHKLNFEYDDDGVLTLKLNDKEVCRTDYNNLQEAMRRMLEIWSGEE